MCVALVHTNFTFLVGNRVQGVAHIRTVRAHERDDNAVLLHTLDFDRLKKGHDSNLTRETEKS